MSNKEIDQAIRDKRLYFIGERLPTDWYEAFRLWLPLAEAGDVKAQYNIGRCYNRGDGVDKDTNLSLEWLMKAANQNDPRAHFNIYLHFLDANNLVEAEKWLAKAVALKEQRALNTLAERIYLQGKEKFELGDNAGALLLFQDALSKEVQKAALGITACGVNITIEETSTTKYSSYVSVTNGTGGTSTTSWKAPAILFKAVNDSPHTAYLSIWVETYDYKDPTKKIGNAVRLDFPMLHPNETADITKELHGYGTDENPVRVFLVGRTLWESGIDNGNYEYYSTPEKILAWEWKAKKSGCFVLTACYGDHDAPTVLQYRQFRDNHLAKHEYGRKFISWYYTHGPKWADRIAQMPKTKAVFRQVFRTLAYLLPQQK